MKFKPWDYQRGMINFALERMFVNDEMGAAWFADPGLGKTATTLLLLHTLRSFGVIKKVLIIAPLRVATGTWPEEIEGWEFDFRYSIVHGTPKKRTQALAANSELFIINPENIVWLSKTGILDMFDMVVVDESTKFKGWMTKRSQAMRNRILPHIPYRLILSGTPAPNCDSELFGQMYIVDDGATLGRTVTFFRANYMQRGGYRGNEWVFLEDKHEDLWQAVAPMAMRLDAEEYLDLPSRVYNEVWVVLPEKVQRQYRRLENELFYELDNGRNVLASGAGDKYHKCRGAANGGFYETVDDDEKVVHHVHDVKTETVGELLEELHGKPAMIAYPYRHDFERLIKAFPTAEAINGDTSVKESKRLIAAWNKQQISKLLVQPTTIEHGINMQFGGNDLIWYGITDRTESHLQLNARLWRPGQTGQVRYHYVLARNTVDVAVWRAWKSKNTNQAAMLRALKEYRDGRR